MTDRGRNSGFQGINELDDDPEDQPPFGGGNRSRGRDQHQHRNRTMTEAGQAYAATQHQSSSRRNNDSLLLSSSSKWKYSCDSR